MNYFITVNGSTVGPMTKEQLMSYNVTPDTPISRDGGQWAPLYTYPELMECYRRSDNAVAVDVDTASKKTLCGILAILLGTLGVQYFVINKPTAGIITIILSIVTCGLWGVVTFVQGILMLCMTNEDFKRKYIDSTSTLPLF